MEFEECLREHGPALWRVIASFAPRGPERDDLAQDVLLAVWQSLPRFRGESSPKTFLLRIAYNRCLSHAWQRSRRRRGSEADVAELPDPRPGADDQLAAQERAERFLGHLRTLPLGQRQVLALALEGLSHAEIATLVGITPENVAVRLGRAREALRRSLEKEAA
ncbi:MAG TPA: sigma-70 family RNA polymerase sigma factor [Myxococcaceae bacterium]|nr:sigma-70 family RNA polymerase sigma factor [Myxococcaceae bacterium]